MSQELKRVFNALILPFWQEKAKYGWLFLGVLCGFTGLITWALIKINYWQAEFYSALQNKDLDQFFKQLIVYTILLVLLVIATIGSSYSERRLHIHWREWLSKRFIQQWVRKNHFYRSSFDKMPIDNPDQRITQDIDLFCKYSIEFFLRFFKEGLKLFSFMAVLWVLSSPLEIVKGIVIPGWLVWISLIYAIIGTVVIIKIGQPLIELDKKQERTEADFRYSLVQMRDHAALITENQTAFLEEQHFYEKLKKVITNYRKLIIQKLWLDLWGESFKYSTYLLPFVFTCPLYFAGKIDFGQLMQLKAAYASVQYSLSLIIHQYHKIAEWKANGQRLLQFLGDMQKDSTDVYISKSPFFKIENVVLFKEKAPLSLPLTLQVNQGEKILLFGPNGSGKSLFFKAVLGIWPELTGKIYHPSPLLQFSQEPYISSFLWQDFTNTEIRWCEKSLQLFSTKPWSINSHSEKQRFCLTQLITKAQRYRHCWVVLDTPLGFLDDKTCSIILEMFSNYLNHCSIVCLETSDVSRQTSFFNKIIPLENIFHLVP